MKNFFKKIIIIGLVLLLIIGYGIYKIIDEPNVNIKEKNEIKEYVEDYLTNKYGDHKYKITDIRYEYHRSDMSELFDYSNPIGYWVDFKCDVVSHSWVTINGLSKDNYQINSDHFIESYYFPNKDGYTIHKEMENIKPKNKLEENILKELREEFEPDAYEVKCNTITLNIPENYGILPTLEELQDNTNLYDVTQFDYKVSKGVEDKNKYSESLKAYIKNKYNTDSTIYFHQENTLVSVFLED